MLQTPTGDMYENRIVMDRNADGFRFCPVGEGLVDFKPIFAAAQKYNVKYLIVMLEQHYGTSELENAKTSMKNIKTLLDE